MLSNNTHQKGISLVESLVAIVVMALGILGVLGVQMRTLADTQSGVRRAQAIRLVEDLSERIKVNPSGLSNMGSYTAAWALALPAAPAVNCQTTACSSANLATFDRNLWLANVRSTMPLGDASIFFVADEPAAGNRRQLGVMISWRENERADGAGDNTYMAGLTPSSTGTANVSCPAGRSCHLQYIQPTARCTPYVSGGDPNPPLYCP